MERRRWRKKKRNKRMKNWHRNRSKGLKGGQGRRRRIEEGVEMGEGTGEGEEE